MLVFYTGNRIISLVLLFMFNRKSQKGMEFIPMMINSFQNLLQKINSNSYS